MTPDPAAVAALARAIHEDDTTSRALHEAEWAGNVRTWPCRPCVRAAESALATDWTPAERAALAAAIVGAQDVECNPFCTWKSAHLYACGKRIADLEAAPAPDLLAAAREALVRYIAVDGSYGMFDAAALHEAREAAARLVTPKEILDEQDRVLDAIRASAAIEEARAAQNDYRILRDTLDILNGVQSAGLLTSGNEATVREFSGLVHRAAIEEADR